MKSQLLDARRQIEKCGWVGPKLEPWCRDSRGRPVHHTDEAVQTFSLLGALQMYGPLDPAVELLGRVVSPGLARLDEFLNSYTPVCTDLEDDWRDESHPLWCGPRWVDPAAERRLVELERGAAGEFNSFVDWLIQPTRVAMDVLRVLSTGVMRSAREKCT